MVGSPEAMTFHCQQRFCLDFVIWLKARLNKLTPKLLATNSQEERRIKYRTLSVMSIVSVFRNFNIVLYHPKVNKKSKQIRRVHFKQPSTKNTDICQKNLTCNYVLQDKYYIFLWELKCIWLWLHHFGSKQYLPTHNPSQSKMEGRKWRHGHVSR